MGYMEFINAHYDWDTCTPVGITKDKLWQIFWIVNLTNCSEAQSIFDIWYQEMYDDNYDY